MIGKQQEWVRILLALVACALAIALELLIDRTTGDTVFPFLTGFAALIWCAVWAGARPSVVAMAVLTGWSIFDLHRHGVPVAGIFARCAIFLLEGTLVSVGSSLIRRAAREAALNDTSWHRQLVETSAEGIWVHDERGVITYANAKMAEILGVGAEGLAGRNVEEFFLPEDQSVERIRAANLRKGRREQFDRRLRRTDGSESWALTSCSLINLGDGIPGSLSMMTDITERKRAEYALRRSEERFRNLFEGVLEGVYQSTPDGRILAANPMLLQMLGLANEAEMNDVNIAHDLYVDQQIRPRLLEQLERDGGFQNVEYELRRRDGQTITVLENARVVRDETGGVLYYEGTLTDITPRKRIEEQLRQAQKVEALGRLAGSVAQDFNNILTIITGFAQLALSELPPSHAARSSTEQVLQAADRAMALTRQLLLFSRRQTPAEKSLDLNFALDQSEAARRGGLTVSLCSEPAPVYAKQEQIEPIVRGLSDNVRRNFPSASLEARVELTDLNEEFCWRCGAAQPGRYVVLSIGNLRSVTVADLFAQPVPAVLQAGESTATGLSATYAIVAECGGFILTGALRASFHVFLPWAVAAEVYAMPPAPFPAGETILLVEDEPLIRELSRDMLERQGYRVIIASNAKEAEQISGTTGSFDLLITDTIMPNITGQELARRLRTAHPGLKVLFISGYAENPQIREEGGPEGSAFLQKPFSADSLGRKIRQMLSRAE
ncbi:MAG TPA: PAS domain S-box protein [Bryobacteraceae bacterium]|jgi:PAS domain S-box-containing protein